MYAVGGSGVVYTVLMGLVGAYSKLVGQAAIAKQTTICG
jgi:hypothetical protein